MTCVSFLCITIIIFLPVSAVVVDDGLIAVLRDVILRGASTHDLQCVVTRKANHVTSSFVQDQEVWEEP